MNAAAARIIPIPKIAFETVAFIILSVRILKVNINVKMRIIFYYLLQMIRGY
jgi:hypothetical protein